MAALGTALLVSFVLGVGAASADPLGAPIYSYQAVPSTNKAGAHPDLYVKFQVGTRADGNQPGGDNEIKDALVETPAGFVGNPHAVPICRITQFMLDECSADTQVGLALPGLMVEVDSFGTCNHPPVNPTPCFIAPLKAPIYNIEPQPGQAGLLAWKAPTLGFPIYTVISARTGSDYGLNAEVKGINTFFALAEFEQTLWGVPGSPIHDNERYIKGGTIPEFEFVPSNSPEKPFLSNPTSCLGPLTSNFVSTAYDGVVDEKTAPWPEMTGCDQLGFNPSQSANPTTQSADSASGLDVDLKVPQNDSPDTPSDSQLKGVTVTMPEGFSINSNAADGKTSCSDTEAHFGKDDEAQCPEHAKIGTLEIDSWALPTPIDGALYLGEPLPGNRYRIFITADGYGVHVKLPGSAYPDPRTGQLTVKFENLPQSPVTEVKLHFFGSERGVLATPARCGTYPVVSEFEPWATGLPNQSSTQFFTIDSGPNGSPCPGSARSFKPGFRAGGASNGAGAHSPLSIYITRQDGDQTLATVGVNTPPGFTATLKGVPKCSDQALRETESSSWSGKSEQAGSKCPSASQVGWSSAGAGAGSKPFYAPGKVYLTGPYKGAPLSFSVVTPAVSGPYDLGNVVNRVAVNVDPTTTAVTALSDPLPQIIEGIPLRLKSVLINLDRKDFTLNPTNCSPFEVTGLLTGNQGGTAEPQSHFQVANCETLDFEPKLRTVLKGSTKRGGHPALSATLTQNPSGESNVARAVVSLPHSEFLAQDHIRTICTRVQYAADKCPAGSIYGHAKAVTPLLDEPVEGPVYLRASNNPLPDLVAGLKGPASLPIEVDLVGKIDSVNGGIRTTFATVPDTPVSKFTLSMQGGKKGLLENSRNLCKGPVRVDAKIAGQSGANANQRPLLEAPCAKARKKAKAKQKRAAAKRAADKNRRAGR